MPGVARYQKLGSEWLVGRTHSRVLFDVVEFLAFAPKGPRISAWGKLAIASVALGELVILHVR